MIDTCQGAKAVRSSFFSVGLQKGIINEFFSRPLTEAGSFNDGWSLWDSRVGYRQTWLRRGAALSAIREFDLRVLSNRVSEDSPDRGCAPETVLDKGSCSYKLPPTGFKGWTPVSSGSLHFNGTVNFVGDCPHKCTELPGNGRDNQLVGLAFGDKSFVTGT